jgi:hypothetical protein
MAPSSHHRDVVPAANLYEMHKAWPRNREAPCVFRMQGVLYMGMIRIASMVEGMEGRTTSKSTNGIMDQFFLSGASYAVSELAALARR